jgi:long-chain fatty acid transport protein
VIPRPRSRRAALAAALAVTLAASPAAAAGLYYADRGVRPLGRGGAFVAGADEMNAIVYNPAGMFDAGGEVLFDASWVHFTSDYTRVANVTQVDPNTGKPVGTYKETYPTVSGTTPFLPIPTIAVSFRPAKKWVVGFGAWAPYAALTSYPATVNGAPAPQRYSLLSLDGSLLSFVGAGVAFAPNKEWRFGAVVGMLTGVFSTQADFSGCISERLACAYEAPSWDVLSQVTAGPIFAPTGSLGAIWIPHPSWRVGVSFQLPTYVRAPATLNVRLPASPLFQDASQSGTSGRVAFDLPWTLRAGVETRALADALKVELSFNYDRWSMHDAITLTPDGIALKNVVGLTSTYYLPPITLQRDFQDSVAVHLGGEYGFRAGGLDWEARSGVAFETSAVPPAYESVLTIDQNKITTALGGSLHWRKLRFDVTYAHVFGFNVNVDPADAKISLVSPVLANPPKQPDYINGGNYSARADVVGLGMTYTFDPAPADMVSRSADPAPAAAPAPSADPAAANPVPAK